MKKMRFFAMLTMAATMAFTFNSCDKDDDDDDSESYNWEYNCVMQGEEYSITGLIDNGSSLAFSDKSIVEGGYVIITYVYDYNKNGYITGKTEKYECSTENVGTYVYEMLKEEGEYYKENDDDMFESIDRSGNVITIVFNGYLFEDYTKEDIVDEYEELVEYVQLYINNPNYGCFQINFTNDPEKGRTFTYGELTDDGSSLSYQVDINIKGVEILLTTTVMYDKSGNVTSINDYFEFEYKSDEVWNMVKDYIDERFDEFYCSMNGSGLGSECTFECVYDEYSIEGLTKNDVVTMFNNAKNK